LLLFFWIAHAIWHGFRYRQFNYVWLRLGAGSSVSEESIWVHASSVGEVELVKPLVCSLTQQHKIVLTTFTASGFQHAQRIMPNTVQIRILPIDFVFTSKAFIRRHDFKLALIAETELWPETLFQLKASRTPLIQVNARLSPRSTKTSNWIRTILQSTLAYFDLHLTRTDKDAELFKRMGVEDRKIRIAGNLKYAHADEQPSYQNLINRPYILFASTHPGEEELFAQLSAQLDLDELVVIAPRHPQRAADIVKTLRPLGLQLKQRSLNQAIDENTQLYLADTLGELKALMAHAAVVIMGGSFVNIGGHNILEPARLGRAIITGPSDANIRQDLDLLLQHRAIIQVNNTDELTQHLSALLNDPNKRDSLATNAGKLMATQEHVLDIYLQIIDEFLAR
jgi:3-deoxy-D-manno-octulosonic-acid transferase